ncbi:MAG TPA: glycogen/starch synthase [Myxococcota bacterium]|jgi:starch synthase
MGLRIGFVSAELSPLAQSGGLGEAVSGLARALAARGHDVCCTLPAYRAVLGHPECPTLAESGRVTLAFPHGELRGRFLAGTLAPRIRLRLLDLPELYERPGLYGDAGSSYWDNGLRFIALARAAASDAGAPRPDVLVAHDWHAALTPCLMRTVEGERWRGAGSVLVVHNNAHQGRFAASTFPLTGLPAGHFHPGGLEFFGDLSLLKAGLLFADRIVAVSPSYARELLEPPCGAGLEGVYRGRAENLTGIANGIDVERYDPAADPALPSAYDAEHSNGKVACRAALLGELGLSAPPPGRLLAVIGRLDAQKGWDVLEESLPELVSHGASLALQGDGDPALASRLRAACARHPRRVSLFVGWDEARARRLYAGADAVLIPSRFEPCGLVQLVAQRYGALPVAHRVGGLSDTIVDRESGILFAPLSAGALVAAVDRAAALAAERTPRALRRSLMSLDVSWAGPAARWEALLEDVARRARAA